MGTIKDSGGGFCVAVGAELDTRQVFQKLQSKMMLIVKGSLLCNGGYGSPRSAIGTAISRSCEKCRPRFLSGQSRRVAS